MQRMKSSRATQNLKRWKPSRGKILCFFLSLLPPVLFLFLFCSCSDTLLQPVLGAERLKTSPLYILVGSNLSMTGHDKDWHEDRQIARLATHLLVQLGHVVATWQTPQCVLQYHLFTSAHVAVLRMARFTCIQADDRTSVALSAAGCCLHLMRQKEVCREAKFAARMSPVDGVASKEKLKAHQLVCIRHTQKVIS